MKMIVHQLSIQKDDDGVTKKVDVSFHAASFDKSPENGEWGDASGALAGFTITVTNPKSFEVFNNSNEFFFDIVTTDSPAPTITEIQVLGDKK